MPAVVPPPAVALRRAQYTRLGRGELAAALSVSAVTLALTLGPFDASLWFATGFLALVLVQGGAYWLLARRWLGRRTMPLGWMIVFRACHALDPPLGFAALGGIVLTWSLPTGLLAVAVWTFGAIEYINYFAARLSYAPGTWWSRVWALRTPQLVRDSYARRP